MKKYNKHDKITMTLFAIGFSLLAFIPIVEDILLSIIVPLPAFAYWGVYIAFIFGFYLLYKSFKKNAIFYRYQSDQKLGSASKLIILGAVVGLVVNVLNIYILGIFQMITI